MEAAEPCHIFLELQKEPRGCHTEKRRKRGKTTAPHVNIKKKRTRAIAPSPDGRAQLSEPTLRSFAFTPCTSRKPQLIGD
ncbi:putative G-protein coupled receptor 34 isoform X2 [Peromyscus maniculatus bairdii]|uniref:putative G-protein coupled receptor 34 isoform X2 n=1 Tax=Peromyscus maniculatus bairdii TaxID=230844 RepID=UPI003FD3DD3B